MEPDICSNTPPAVVQPYHVEVWVGAVGRGGDSTVVPPKKALRALREFVIEIFGGEN